MGKLFTILALIYWTPLFSQTKRDISEQIQRKYSMESKPLVYANTNKIDSTTYNYSGIVSEQSSVGFYCGTLCHSGTMKIKIDESNDSYIYVLIPCFVSNVEDVGKRIQLTVTSLPENRDIGCYSNVINTIDSKGQAFYYCESFEIE